jgi:hypothetical protein
MVDVQRGRRSFASAAAQKSIPTLEQVQEILDEDVAHVNGLVRARGYAIPPTGTELPLVYRRLLRLSAAIRAELGANNPRDVIIQTLGSLYDKAEKAFAKQVFPDAGRTEAAMDQQDIATQSGFLDTPVENTFGQVTRLREFSSSDLRQ